MCNHVVTGQIRTGQFNLDQVKLSPDISWTQNFLDLKFSLTQIFSDQKLFWALICFGSNFFWTQNALENGLWLWRWHDLFWVGVSIFLFLHFSGALHCYFVVCHVYQLKLNDLKLVQNNPNAFYKLIIGDG